MMLSRRSFTACFTAFLLAGSHIPALSEQISDQFSPEITIARQAKDNQKSVFSKNWMISAANFRNYRRLLPRSSKGIPMNWKAKATPGPAPSGN